MNDIRHYKITIDLDIWAPQQKLAEKDIDELIYKIKSKRLLEYCGNVKLHIGEH